VAGDSQILRPAAYCVIYDDVGRVLLTEWSRPEKGPAGMMQVHRSGLPVGESTTGGTRSAAEKGPSGMMQVQGWTLPGGGLDFGEHPADAATREVFEETGLHVELLGDPKVDSVYFPAGDLRANVEFQALRFVYRARVVGGVFGIVDVGGSTTDIGWFDPTHLESLRISDNVARSLAWFPASNAIALDHMQLAIPANTEGQARAFWIGLIGLREVEKPPALKARGGAHFESGNLCVHVGIEAEFVPARKAHPALRVRDIDALALRLTDAGYQVRWSDEVPNTRRFHTDDPFGNRLEFVA
jgi:8-oxo-dGTP pyrophosphatase MutT (NUDIX family)